VDTITLSIKKFIFSRLKDVSTLIFPEACSYCKSELTSSENHICGLCELELKRTYFEGFKENSPLDKLLKKSTFFTNLDALIPVPIHHKKAFIRGYNQSELLARGISSEIGIPVLKNLTVKRKNTSSQTRKSNQERWENVVSVFQSQDLSYFKHIALVDDVITTGSTIESLANELLNSNPHLKISVISLAFAKS